VRTATAPAWRRRSCCGWGDCTNDDWCIRVSAMRGLDRSLPAIGALEEDLRKRMYLFIRQQTHPVSRDEAAAAVGISRTLAAFHLDKLVERGLLRATYAHPVGRSSSQAGRSSKLYEPSDLSFDLSLPERRYDLLADVLAEAVSSGGAESVAWAIAARRGKTLGKHARVASEEARFPAVVKLLSRHGFEPSSDLESGTLFLRNCPFRDVARESPALVCQMNLAFIRGVLEGAEVMGAEAELDPAPGRCCVTLKEKPE
jgi:predicted ArsR family transcriptional regulator